MDYQDYAYDCIGSWIDALLKTVNVETHSSIKRGSNGPKPVHQEPSDNVLTVPDLNLIKDEKINNLTNKCLTYNDQNDIINVKYESVRRITFSIVVYGEYNHLVCTLLHTSIDSEQIKVEFFDQKGFYNPRPSDISFTTIERNNRREPVGTFDLTVDYISTFNSDMGVIKEACANNLTTLDTQSDSVKR